MEHRDARQRASQKYYETNREIINEKRREQSRIHQREYNAKLRQMKIENGTYRPVGFHRRKVVEVVYE